MKLYIGSCPYGNNRGYTPVKEEKLSPKSDLKEGFDLAMELSTHDQDRIECGASLFGQKIFKVCSFLFLKKNLQFYILRIS
jgi:hypothetical protein